MTIESNQKPPKNKQAQFLADRYRDETSRRFAYLKQINQAESAGLPRRAMELELCRRDPLHFIDNWCLTFEPRFLADGVPAHYPLVLFPRQREFVQWMMERISFGQDGVCAKSRDVGVTWMAACLAAHNWLFIPGSRIGFGSRKLELVDRKGDSKSILEKIRVILRNIPVWMLPPTFDFHKHDNFCRLLNPDNGASIIGEGGDEIGRGDRCGWYVIDEAAHLEHPELTDAALSATTRCRIDLSTPCGMGNPFYRRYSTFPKEQVFTFSWKNDPRKDQAWYDAEVKRLGDPVVIAQEIDINFAASEHTEWPADFFGDHIWFDEWPMEDWAVKVMALDPSKGKGRGTKDEPGDYSVWIMMAVDRDFCLWLDADLDNVRPVEPLSYNPNMKSIVTDGIVLYRQFAPHAVLIEVNGFQEWVASSMQRIGKQVGLNIPLFVKDNRIPKQVRIRTLAPYFAQRRFRVRRSPGGQKLVQQLREFPLGEHDDGPDCVKAAEEMADAMLAKKVGVHDIHPYR